MERIEWEFIREVADGLDVGQSTKVHHCKEGRGNDRLYVEKHSDYILYHCFHCGAGGRHYNTRDGKPLSDGRDSETEMGELHASDGGGRIKSGTGNPVTLPTDSVGDTRLWPENVKLWYRSVGITDAQAREHGFAWNPRLERLILPVWDNGTLVGWQGRLLSSTPSGRTKYHTVSSDPNRFFWRGGNFTDKRILLVEDILSAIKWKDQVYCIALLGSTLRKSVKEFILRMDPSEVVIWLDNDNAMVRKSSLNIFYSLEPYTNVNRITEEGNPKSSSKGVI